MESLLCPGPSAHEISCAPSKSGVSVSPNPVELLHSNPAALQSHMFWGLLLTMPDPQAGEPDLGLRTPTPMREPLWYNYFPACGSPSWQVWDLIILCKHLSYRLFVASSLSLGVEYLFW